MEKIEGNLTIYCSIVLQSIHITSIVLLWWLRCWKSSHPLHITYVALKQLSVGPQIHKRGRALHVHLFRPLLCFTQCTKIQKKAKYQTLQWSWPPSPPLSACISQKNILEGWRLHHLNDPPSEVVLYHNKHFYVTVCFDYYSYATNFITITHCLILK